MKRLLYLFSLFFIHSALLAQVPVVNKGTKIKLSTKKDTMYIHGYYLHDVGSNTLTNPTDSSFFNSGTIIIKGHFLDASRYVYRNTEDAYGKLIFLDNTTSIAIPPAKVPSGWSTPASSSIWGQYVNSPRVVINATTQNVYSHKKTESIKEVEFVSGRLYKRDTLKLSRLPFSIDSLKGRIVGESETNRFIHSQTWNQSGSGFLYLDWQGPPTAGDSKGLGIVYPSNASSMGNTQATRVLSTFQITADIHRSFDRVYQMQMANYQPGQFQFTYLNIEKDILTDFNKLQLFKSTAGSFSNTGYTGVLGRKDIGNKKLITDSLALNSSSTVVVLGECPTSPLVNIVPNKISVCNPKQIPLVINCQDGIGAQSNVRFQWFKDGVPVVPKGDSSHLVVQAGGGMGTGQYSVIVKFNNGCYVTDTVDVYVNPNPVANFTVPGTGTPNCYGTVQPFVNNSTISSGSITESRWLYDVSNAGTADNQTGLANGSYNFTANTATVTYTTRLIVKSDSNCYDTIAKPITIYTRPQVSIGTPMGVNICEDAALTLNNTSTTADAFNNALFSSTWQYGDGQSAINSGAGVSNAVSHSYANPTNSNLGRTVKLIVQTSKGCKDSTTVAINVYPKPIASPAITLHAGAKLYKTCQDTGVAFSYSGQFNVASVMWNFGHAGTNTFNSTKRPLNGPANVLFKGAGTFTPRIVLTSANACKDSFNTSAITIHPLPVAGYTVLDDTLCHGTAMQFTNTSTQPSGANTNLWMYGNGATSTSSTHSYSYPLSGVYTAKLKAQTPLMCKDTFEMPLRVKPMPSVSFTTANKCEDSLVGFDGTVVSTPNGTLFQPTWHWDFKLSSTNANYAAQRAVEDPQVLYASFGTYNPDVYVVAEQCTSNVPSKTLVIHANPTANFSITDNCNRDTTYLANTSTLAQGNYSYQWNLGDATILNNQPAIKKVYANAQNYTVRLTATSDSNCISLKEVVHRNYDISKSLFDTTQATVCNLIPSVFVNQSFMKHSSGVGYTWRFGDTNTSSLTNPSHTYANPNTYNVTLLLTPTDTTNICRDSITKQVIIHPNPVTDFSFGDNCKGDTLPFQNLSTIAYTNMVAHYWDFGDGFKDTTLSPVAVKHTYSNPQNYPVTLTVKSDKNCVISKTDTIRNFALPTADFDTSQATVCIFDTSKFINLSTMSDSSNMLYTWDMFHNNHTDTAKNPSYYYPPTYAIYNVKLVVRPADLTNICRDSITRTIHLLDLPDSSFAVTQDTFCLGTTIYFIKTNAQGQTNYKWWFGDGTVDSNNVTYVGKEYAGAGNYTATLKATSPYGCKSDSVHHFRVIPVPTAGFTVVPDSVCLGQQMQFTNTSDTIAGLYIWNFGDNSTPDSSISRTYHPTRTYAAANSWQVELKALRTDTASGLVCSSSQKKWAVVEPLPVVSFTATRNSSLGNRFAFYNNTYLPNGFNGNLNYKWHYGNGDSSTQNAAFYNYDYATLGSYIVKLRATSDFGCFDEFTDTLEAVSVPSAAFALSDSTACGARQINFTNSSTNATSYTWYFGDNTTSTVAAPSHTFNQPGRYLVQLVAADTNGYKDTAQKLVVINAVPSLDFSASSVCAGNNVLFSNNSGILSTESLQYTWYYGNGDSSNVSSPAYVYPAGGSFNVMLRAVSDSGCADTLTKPLTIHNRPVPNFDSAAARVCKGGVSVLTSSSTIAGAYTISSLLWRIQGDPTQYTSASVNKTFTGAGAYSVELVAVSNQGCRDSVTKLVHVDSLPQILLADTQRTCGTSLALNAGNPGSSYQWSTAATSQSITVSTGGLYRVTVTLPGGSGCKDSVGTYIFLNTQVDPNLGNNFSVCGDTLLDAKNPGSTYLWSNAATTRTIPVNASGTYRVTVTDPNSCIGIDSVTISYIAPPVVQLGSDTVECAGTAITFDAGSQGDTYLWSNSATTQTTTIYIAGTYTVAVTDTATQCVSRDTVQVSYRPSPAVSLGNDRTVCGSQSVLLNAGTFQNAGYLWSDNTTLQTLTATTSGVYWVKVTDNVRGCSRYDTVNVQINALPQINLGSARTVCSGASSLLDAGGTTGFSYSWSTNDTTQTVQASVSGFYSVTVTDTNTCTNQSSVQLAVLQVPNVQLGSDTTLCSGKSLLLVATSGGNNVTWQNNTSAPSFTVNQAGTYYATAINGACVSTDTISVAYVNSPSVNLGTQNASCAGSLVLDGGNYGGSWSWNGGDTTRTKVATSSGLYSVNVIDSNGCRGSASMYITVYPLPTRNLINRTACAGSSVFLNAANSGASYLWSNSSTQQAITVTSAATYRVTITDANGCAIIDSSIVTMSPVPTVNLGAAQTVCAGQQATLDAQNPGASYTWSTNATTQTINVVNSGYYSVTVTNAGNCTATGATTVTVQGAPVVNLGLDQNGCAGDSLTLSSIVNYPGSYTYLWTGGAVTSSIKAGATGVYRLTVTNNFSCSNTDSVNVTINAVPSVNLGPDNTVCSDTTLNAGNAGAAYLWNNNATTQQITANLTGTYIVAVTSQGCTGKDTIQLTVNPGPVVNLGADRVACVTTPPTLDAQNFGASYLWSNSATSQTITPNTGGNYWVRVTNTGGCAKTDTVLVTINNGPTDNLGSDINVCWDNQPITLDAGNAGSTYRWNTGAGSRTIQISNSGTYSVSVTDGAGCADTAYIDVTLKAMPVVNLGPDRSICDSVLLNAGNSGSTYLWSDATTQRTLRVRQNGTYHVAVTNALSCTAYDTVAITISNGPVANLGADTSVCSGQFLTYRINQPGVSILWFNTTTTDSLRISSSGDYWVKLTDSSGCFNTDTVSVSLAQPPVFELGADTTICANQTRLLQVDSGYAQYAWTGPNAFTDSARSINANTGGTWQVQVRTDKGCVATDSIKLRLLTDTVRARFLMPSEAAIGDSVKMVDLSTGDISSWRYAFGDNTSDTARDPIKIYSLVGKYDVTLTVSNGLCSDSRMKQIDVKLELRRNIKPEDEIVPNDVVQILSAKVYPNPNIGEFTLDLRLSDADDFEMYIFDMNGVVHHAERVNEVSEFEKKYFLGHLARGMYFLKIITASEQVQIIKIVVNE
jgi:PKD repeat protein